jgi:hypothetical protein
MFFNSTNGMMQKNHLKFIKEKTASLLLAFGLLLPGFIAAQPFDPFPLSAPAQNAMVTKWLKKPVLDSLMIDDMEQNKGWTNYGIGEISYTQDRAMDGNRSIRFHTYLRDYDHYKRNHTPWDSFTAGIGGFTHMRMDYDPPQDWSDFNRISLWVYPHNGDRYYWMLQLKTYNQGTPENGPVTPSRKVDFQNLTPGEWNQCVYEIPHLERDKIERIELTIELIGHHPEEEGYITFDIDRLQLQRVVADQYEGWTVEPGKFSFSHVGYRPLDSKVAMVGSGGGSSFEIIDQDDAVVFTGNVEVLENKNGRFHLLDFSDLRIEGTYRIRCGSLVSDPFPIDEDIWIDPVFKAVNFYHCQRCGYHVPGIHLECHKDCQGSHGEEKIIINGGFHDAGDCSQGHFRTAMACYAMMRKLEFLDNRSDLSELAERIRAELVWGLEWLLKTRFGDGVRMSWSVTRLWTDNTIGTRDDVVSPASNVPWENFLGAAVEYKASGILESFNPDLAGRARVAAVEDWQAAMDSRDTWNKASYREAAWGVISSLLLGEMTGDQKYKDQAIHFGNLLMQCQEQGFLDGIPITSYFYTDTDRRTIIHNNHGTFDECLMIALPMLCREFLEHENWMSWYSSAVLYSEFFMKRGSRFAAPYYHLPNSVWTQREITNVKDEVDLRQIKDGTSLNNGYYLRTFPVWKSLHGSTNIQLSETWALAEASSLRNDPEGMKLVGKQLQWILGNNPFGQSLMYGAGYDFTPLHAVRMGHIVGALPVGIDCMSDDKPFWSHSTNNSTFKEIWIEPVNRFMGTVSVYASEYQLFSEIRDTVEIETETLQSDGGVVAVTITLTGTGKHEIEIKSFNAGLNIHKIQVDLSGDNREEIELELNVTDQGKPYVAIISVDKNPDLRNI